MAASSPVRPVPLEGEALRAALLNGLRLWARSTGTPVSGGMVDVVDFQLSCIRLASHAPGASKIAAESPLSPPANPPAGPDEAEEPPLPWWKRD